MGSRKVNTEGIDEELLLASIGRRYARFEIHHRKAPKSTILNTESKAFPQTPPKAMPKAMPSLRTK